MRSFLSKNKKLLTLLTGICLVLMTFGSVYASGDAHSESNTEAHSEGDVEAKGWQATDSYRVLNFLVLAFGLYFLLRKPVSQALSARIEGIKEQLESLKEKKQSAESQLVKYDSQLAKLDKEAENIVAEYVKQGEDAKLRILDEAALAAKKLENQAMRNINHELKTAKAKLQQDILDKALVKAEEIVKSKMTSEDQDRLVNEYLNKVVVS